MRRRERLSRTKDPPRVAPATAVAARRGSPMRADDMILISVDDHIVEPPDMFKNHLSKKYADEAPRLVHNPDGSDSWQFRDVVIPNVRSMR